MINVCGHIWIIMAICNMSHLLWIVHMYLICDQQTLIIVSFIVSAQFSHCTVCN